MSKRALPLEILIPKVGVGPRDLYFLINIAGDFPNQANVGNTEL